jgi:hypothetical protein
VGCQGLAEQLSLQRFAQEARWSVDKAMPTKFSHND